MRRHGALRSAYFWRLAMCWKGESLRFQKRCCAWMFQASVATSRPSCRNGKTAQRERFRAGQPAGVLGSFVRTSQVKNFGQALETLENKHLEKERDQTPFPGGRGCLGEGRLGLPGQVWELRFLQSFPSFPRENRSSKSVWGSAWKSQTSFFQTSAVF